MVDFDSIGRRLRESRDALGLSQTEMAEAVLAGGARGATRQTQSNYEKGERMPDAGYLAVAADLGVDVLYVITGRREQAQAAPAVAPGPHMAEQPPKWGGKGDGGFAGAHPVRPDTTQSGAPPVGGFSVISGGGLLASTASRDGPPLRLAVAFDGGRTQREFQVIPRFRSAASAGKNDAQRGDDTMAVDAAGVLAMDRAFMRDQLGTDDRAYVTVAVKGDSMERTLIDGETIIIDSGVNEVDCNGIYVVRVGKALLVKRLVLGMDGSVLVKSDNPAYASYDREFSAEQAQDLRVVGRMVWPKFR